jgi:hypothetical protein
MCFVEDRINYMNEFECAYTGSFYTPLQWVKLSQQYMSDVWENLDAYYIWDCAAGTGNLLKGLSNKNNVFASTLDQTDVDIMHALVDMDDLHLLHQHIFQFDFLNDDFKSQMEDGKLPDELVDIISDTDKRKKLIVYINPPYAEASSTAARHGTKQPKTGVATQSEVYRKYSSDLDGARKELFAQFLVRIYAELRNCKIGEFSTLKIFGAPNFIKFRNFFKAKFLKGFVVPAYTFDNVNGQFPIGFKIWDTSVEEHIANVEMDVYDVNSIRKNTSRKNTNSIAICNLGSKTIHSFNSVGQYVNTWFKQYRIDDSADVIELITYVSNDFQNRGKTQIVHNNKPVIAHDCITRISKKNIIEVAIYMSVRICMKMTWLNNPDQFTYPNNKWETDIEFQNDCLAYMLFHTDKNKIRRKYGVNHWIPFTEQQLNLTRQLESHYMIDFLMDKTFSDEANDVFAQALVLWRYYIEKAQNNRTYEPGINASLYDIRGYFQGFSDNGKMNTIGSKEHLKHNDDTQYITLMEKLNNAMDVLAAKITPKVYEYGFLLK